MKSPEIKLITPKLSPTDEQKRREVDRALRQLGGEKGRLKSLADLQRANALFDKFEGLTKTQEKHEANVEENVEAEFQRIKEYFPRAKRMTVEIDDKTAGEMLDELNNNKVSVSESAVEMMGWAELSKKSVKKIEMVILKIGDFMIDKYSPLNILGKAQKLGLALCPPYAIPYCRLQRLKQTEKVYAGMQGIRTSHG